MTLCGIFLAFSGIMADTGERPHVVHGPYHRLSGSKNALDIFQGKHALVNPVQVNHICLTDRLKPLAAQMTIRSQVNCQILRHDFLRATTVT